MEPQANYFMQINMVFDRIYYYALFIAKCECELRSGILKGLQLSNALHLYMQYAIDL